MSAAQFLTEIPTSSPPPLFPPTERRSCVFHFYRLHFTYTHQGRHHHSHHSHKLCVNERLCPGALRRGFLQAFRFPRFFGGNQQQHQNRYRHTRNTSNTILNPLSPGPLGGKSTPVCRMFIASSISYQTLFLAAALPILPSRTRACPGVASSAARRQEHHT